MQDPKGTQLLQMYVMGCLRDILLCTTEVLIAHSCDHGRVMKYNQSQVTNMYNITT